MPSTGVRNVNSSERPLKTLAEPAPSKPGVAGSNPAGVALIPTKRDLHSDKIGTNRVRSPRENIARATFVYVISGGPDLTKIGISRSPRKRLSTLQVATPAPLQLFHTFRPAGVLPVHVERGALLLLRRWHVSGEWLKCQPGLAEVAIRGAATGDRRIPAFIDLFWQRQQAWQEFWLIGARANCFRSAEKSQAAACAQEGQGKKLDEFKSLIEPFKDLLEITEARLSKWDDTARFKR